MIRLYIIHQVKMKNKLSLISLLISFSLQVFAQDVIPRRAPLDDSISSFEDSMKNDEGDSSKFTKIPIIIDSTEGWEWISGLIMRRLRMYLKHTRYGWIIRNILLILSIELWIIIMI